MEKEKEFPIGFALYIGPVTAVLRIHHPKIIKEVLQSSGIINVQNIQFDVI